MGLGWRWQPGCGCCAQTYDFGRHNLTLKSRNGVFNPLIPNVFKFTSSGSPVWWQDTLPGTGLLNNPQGVRIAWNGNGVLYAVEELDPATGEVLSPSVAVYGAEETYYIGDGTGAGGSVSGTIFRIGKGAATNVNNRSAYYWDQEISPGLKFVTDGSYTYYTIPSDSHRVYGFSAVLNAGAVVKFNHSTLQAEWVCKPFVVDEATINESYHSVAALALTSAGLAVALTPDADNGNYGAGMIDVSDGSMLWGASLDGANALGLHGWNHGGCIATNGSDVLIGARNAGPTYKADTYCFNSGGSVNWRALSHYTTPVSILSTNPQRIGTFSADCDGTDWYVCGNRAAING